MSNSTLTIIIASIIALIALFYILITADRKTVITILGIVLVVAILTNPKQDEHTAALTNYLMNRTGSDYTDASGILAVGIAKNALSSMVSVKSFILFSITNVNYRGQSKNIGVGAFGNVWIYNY